MCVRARVCVCVCVRVKWARVIACVDQSAPEAVFALSKVGICMRAQTS